MEPIVPMLRLACLLITALLGATPLRAADLAVMPVALQLDASRDRGTVRVVNQGREAVLLQADAIGWRRVDGVDLDEPTDGLVVNPPLFRIEPGATQIVRLGLRRQPASDRAATYRLLLRELPPAPGSGAGTVSGQVRVLLALRVPVYVAPPQVVRDERWEARRDGDRHVEVRVVNAGNVHLRLDRLRLVGTDPALSIAEHRTATVLFPGEERRIRMASQAELPDQPLSLQASTDRGPHDVVARVLPR